MRTTFVLFTASYPYSVAAENGFLPQELAVLREHFERVILVPQKTGGTIDALAGPNVEVDTTYAARIATREARLGSALRALLDPGLYREAAGHVRAVLPRARNARRLLVAQLLAGVTGRWIRDRLATLPEARTVVGTWWFDGTTLGVARAVGGRVPVVTRAHGSDLYAERHAPPYMPFRAEAMARVTRVYSASRAGARYLEERYPSVRSKVRVGLLGVRDPGFLNAPSTDGVVRLASCSFLLPVKRVDLMIRGVAAAGRLLPETRFEWTHHGDGDAAPLRALAASVMPRNVRHEIAPFPGPAGLYDHYRTHRIDLFMNTSESEGTPVSTMEALSVGIPMLATAVGGNAEIVTGDNGVLVPADASAEDIGSAIAALVNAPARLQAMRVASRAKWEREYNAARNYAGFAEDLKEL